MPLAPAAVEGVRQESQLFSGQRQALLSSGGPCVSTALVHGQEKHTWQGRAVVASKPHIYLTVARYFL